jgi:ribonuclease Z
MRPIVHCQLVNGPFGDPVVYAEVMFERRALLFDIGEIGALVPRKLLRISHVFVTHAHMDHFSGFDRLLRLLLGRTKTVALYGPAGFIDRIEHKLGAYTWNVIHRYTEILTFDVYEVHSGGALRHACFCSSSAFRREMTPETQLGGDLLVSITPLTVRCAVLDHGTPCLGFAVEEPAHVNIWKTRLDERGLGVGPWLKDLKRAILQDAPASTPIHVLRRTAQALVPVTLPLGEIRDSAIVTAGQKIAYVVDVRNSATNAERIERLAFGADILFLECAFLEADAAEAARKNHLTAHQAGALARRAQVKRLVPCHFSMRYSDAGNILWEEAQRAFMDPA